MTGISNFAFDSKKSTLYVVLDFEDPSGNYPKIVQKAYKINLSSLEKEQLWLHKIGDDKYPEGGPAGIDKVIDNKYLIFWLGICYNCGGFDPHGSVLLNIETKQEKYLGKVGNFNFDLSNNIVTYQNLTPFDEACNSGPGCLDGERTIYKPSGQIYTETLP